MMCMFKYLFILILCACSPLFAAQEELTEKDSDVFFKLGGGARVRQYYLQDGAAGGLTGAAEDFNDTSHRLQLDVRLDKGEYFQTFFRLINANVWGEHEDGDDELFIQQGYGQWKVSDFLSFRFGRAPLEIGRGLVYGLNEWENLPTYYDGFSALFDWSVLDISVHALKFYDIQRGLGSSAASKPEIAHYILDLSFKDISDMISMADLSFVQIVGDMGTVPSTGVIVPKQRLQRFGFDLVASGVYYEVGSSVSYVTGNKDNIIGVNESVKQFMLDGEGKWIMPEWSRFNLWVGGHYDSGDDTPGDNINQQYDPLNYNLHQNAGRMDFFRFGNLTFLRSGMSVHLLSDWMMGVEYFMFQKTAAAGAISLERSVLQTQFNSNTLSLSNEKDLGQEFDFWVGKKFQSGVNVELSFNYLQPGTAMKNAYEVAGNVPHPLDKALYNVILDIGIFF